MVIGTCSLCGGPVGKDVANSLSPAECLHCGAVQKYPHGPMIEMEKKGPLHPFQALKWQEASQEFCWNCNVTRPLMYWEVDRLANPMAVGKIYAQCSVCGAFKKSWDGSENVPPDCK